MHEHDSTQPPQYVDPPPAAREAFFEEQTADALREIEPRTFEEHAYVGELVRCAVSELNRPDKKPSGTHAHGVDIERRAELRTWFRVAYPEMTARIRAIREEYGTGMAMTPDETIVRTMGEFLDPKPQTAEDWERIRAHVAKRKAEGRA